MILGSFLLWAALIATLSSMAVYVFAALGKKWALQTGRNVYVASSVLVVLVSVLFMVLILRNHFEIDYIWGNSSVNLPLLYKISVFWAGQQGSFLFWALCSAVIGLFLMKRSGEFEGWVMVFWGAMQSFLMVLLLVDSPFKPTPTEMLGLGDGRGLRELLQNPWMAIHPPVVFLGYAAMSVPAAFAFSALVRRDWKGWVKSALPWAVFGWVTLGAGIILGAYWAYEVLGWGGYWAWDPVENASLVPWLTGTALLHGMLAERYRGSFRKANFALALVTLVLIFDATFLTRTDALKDFSVHTFGGSPITSWILWFMRAVLVVSAVLIARQWKKIDQAPSFTRVISKDFLFFLAVVLFTVSAAWVLAGTSWPIIGKIAGRLPFADGLGTHSPQLADFFHGRVGRLPEFYSKTLSPIAMIILALMALAPVLAWRRDESTADQRGLGIIVAAIAVGIPFIGPRMSASMFVALAAVIAVISFAALVINFSVLVRSGKLGLRTVGGFAAHVGMGFLFVGVVLSSNGGEKKLVTLPEGKPVDAEITVRGIPHASAPYRFTYDGLKVISENKAGMSLDVEYKGKSVQVMPTVQVTRNSEMLQAPRIIKGLARDIYISPSYVPVPGQAVFSKDKPEEVGGVKLTFMDFIGSPKGDHVTLGARLEAVVDGQIRTVIPYLTTNTKRPAKQTTTKIPGTRASLVVTQIMADDKAVQVELTQSGGVPQAVVLKRGEQIKAGDLALTFKKWIMPQDGNMGSMRIGAEIEVATKGKTVTVSPMYDPANAPETTTESKPVSVPGADMTVALSAADINGGKVQLDIVPSAAVIDVSTKPFISLLWIGSILALAGGGIAMWRRSSESVEKLEKVSAKAKNR